MRTTLVALLLALAATSSSAADERANLSIEDVISGFEARKLFYFELLLQNGKYTKGFNKCLASKPAESEWVREHCKKNQEFKNAFQCSEGGPLTHVWFVYENASQCEEVRAPMKERMDALLAP